MRQFNLQRQRVKPAYEAGFTLIELMIAMTLGITLIAGLVTVFQGNRQSSELNNAMADMQESARYTFDTLARDARMAGFQGCVDINTSSASIKAQDAPTTNLFNTALTGSIVTSSTQWDPAPPPTFQIPSAGIVPIIDSDVLSLQFANQEVFGISAMSTPSADIVLDQTPENIQAGDMAIISNCQVADLFQVTAVNDATLKHGGAMNNGSAALSAPYGQGGATNLAMLAKFEANIYFLADTGRQNKSGDAIISLYRQTLPYSQPPQEMVEGVEQFRIKYGVRDPASNAITWGTADQVAGNFSQVQSLQIGLLMSSYERLAAIDDSKDYYVAGDVITPEGAVAAVTGQTHEGDRRFRLAFNTTINIRNRR